MEKKSLTYYGITRGLPTGQSLPFIKSLSGCALLKDAGILFFLASLNVVRLLSSSCDYFVG